MKRVLFVILWMGAMVPAFAWGPRGHRVIAALAYQYVEPQVRVQLDDILGTRGLIYDAAWADELKSDTIYRHSYDWHYEENGSGRMLWALDSLYGELARDRRQVDALRFYSHLIGDRYCPLHMGNIADRGGNTIQIMWFNRPTNLHKVWDEVLIDERGFSYTEYATYLDDRFGATREQVAKTTAEEDIAHNQALAQDIYAYQTTWDGNAYHYLYRWKNTVDEQLFAAAVHLANLLNQLYR